MKENKNTLFKRTPGEPERVGRAVSPRPPILRRYPANRALLTELEALQRYSVL